MTSTGQTFTFAKKKLGTDTFILKDQCRGTMKRRNQCFELNLLRYPKNDYRKCCCLKYCYPKYFCLQPPSFLCVKKP